MISVEKGHRNGIPRVYHECRFLQLCWSDFVAMRFSETVSYMQGLLLHLLYFHRGEHQDPRDWALDSAIFQLKFEVITFTNLWTLTGSARRGTRPLALPDNNASMSLPTHPVISLRPGAITRQFWLIYSSLRSEDEERLSWFLSVRVILPKWEVASMVTSGVRISKPIAPVAHYC